MSNVIKNLIPQQLIQLRGGVVLWILLLPVWLVAQPAAEKRRVNIEIITDLGNITVELYNETPIHRDNFVKLVKAGHYDSLLFHRVIPGFMIQGGDAQSRRATAEAILGNDTTETTLPAEIVPGLINQRGALAAARDGDDVNPERRSSSSQFYIVQGRTYQAADLERIEERNARSVVKHKFTEAEKLVYATNGGAAHLDGTYTVFGIVVEGMDVVDAIAALPTNAHDRPLNDIRMFMRLK